MVLLLVLSWCIIIVCVLVHLCQHSKCKSYQNNEKEETSARDGCCPIRPTIHFFPVSFALYMLLILILTSLIIAKYILNEEPNLMSLSVFVDSPQLMHLRYHFTGGHHWFEFTSVQMSISFVYIDYAIYALMIMAMIWESFFYFYRYYTTKSTAFYLYSPTLMDVLKPFSLYMTIILILFLIQTQIYYCVFPLVVLCFGFCKFYWIFQTTRIVVQSAELLSVKKQVDVTQEMQSSLIYNVIFMRDLSVICTICSCLYVSAFMVVYDMTVVYLFPLLWTLSIACFLVQFIRNRRYIKHICCGTKMNPVSKQAVEGSLFICVEDIDKDREIANKTEQCNIQPTEPVIKTKPDVRTISAASLDLPNTDPEPKLITYTPKFHSTGDLISLLQQKAKQTMSRDRNAEKQLPLMNINKDPTTAHPGPQDTTTFTSMSTPIPTQAVQTPEDDSTVYCDYNGRLPSVQLTVIDSAQSTSTGRNQIDYRVTQKRNQSSDIGDQTLQSLQISVTQAGFESQDSRNKHTLTVTSRTTTHRHHIKKSGATCTSTHSFTPSLNSKLTRTPSKPMLLDKISDVTCSTCDYSWSGANPGNPPTPFEIHNNSNFTGFTLPAVFNNAAIPEIAESQMSNTPNADRTPGRASRGYLGAKLNIQYPSQRRSQPSISSVMQLFVAQGFSDIIND